MRVEEVEEVEEVYEGTKVRRYEGTKEPPQMVGNSDVLRSTGRKYPHWNGDELEEEPCRRRLSSASFCFLATRMTDSVVCLGRRNIWTDM